MNASALLQLVPLIGVAVKTIDKLHKHKPEGMSQAEFNRQRLDAAVDLAQVSVQAIEKKTGKEWVDEAKFDGIAPSLEDAVRATINAKIAYENSVRVLEAIVKDVLDGAGPAAGAVTGMSLN